MRLNASRWATTSASTNTSTSPDATRAPRLRAAAGPAPRGVVTTIVCSGGSSAAAIASRHRSSVGGSFVAGMIAVTFTYPTYGQSDVCGIFGFVAASPQDFPAALAERIDRRLAHRGPDDRGWLSVRGATLRRGTSFSDTSADVYLLHRRLAILDLSDGAHQPMSSPDGRHHLVFNGEIYNYLELRGELESLGHRFASDGDTAVLLAALREWGEAALTRLVGMFAFALLDMHERTLLLARDPLGIKPLYHARWRGGIAFASEIAPLLELPSVGRAIDAGRAHAYLRYADSGSGEETFFADVRQLAAGHTLTASLDRPAGAHARRYWRLEPDDSAELSFDEAAARLRELFADSVRLHTRSDVPIGITLSGGIDSSAIACSVRDQMSDGGDLRAFSYTQANPVRSERRWAELVAQSVDARTRWF